MDSNFGLRAEDAAPRSFAPRDSGRPIRARPRREVRLAGLALCPLRCNPAEELIQASSTRPARSALSQHAVTLPASRFASHSIAPHTASAPRYRLCTIFGASDPLGTISQGIRTGSEPLRKEARLLGPALCQLLSNPQQSRPKPQQTDIATPACSPLASLGLCI